MPEEHLQPRNGQRKVTYTAGREGMARCWEEVQRTHKGTDRSHGGPSPKPRSGAGSWTWDLVVPNHIQIKDRQNVSAMS